MRSSALIQPPQPPGSSGVFLMVSLAARHGETPSKLRNFSPPYVTLAELSTWCVDGVSTPQTSSNSGEVAELSNGLRCQ